MTKMIKQDSQIGGGGIFLANVKIILSKRRLLLLVIDTVLFLYAYGGMLFILSEVDAGFMAAHGMAVIWKGLLFYACIMAVRLCSGIYNTVWRYASTKLHLRLLASDIVGGCLFCLTGCIFPAFSIGVARTLVTVLLLMLGTLVSRLVYQAVYARSNQVTESAVGHRIAVAIVGAGNIGATLAEELLRNPKSCYYPYCFIDTDPAKIGNLLNGIRVYREDEDIIETVKSFPIQKVVIALPDAMPEEKNRLYEFYRQTECDVMLYDYPVGAQQTDNPPGKRELREFRIDDLLFRDSRSVTSLQAKEFYKGKTILVTGGGGSIGSELCRQIASLHPKRLVILEIYENNAYEIQQELVHIYGDALALDVAIASIRDEERIDEIFAEVRPDIVFHAAAHKHVPLMEECGCEAIKNNVFGTYNVANCAEKYGVKKFVMISTDKAVNPTNIMGASKRLCEMLIQCRTGSKTVFTAVRFGNVLGSNGSVIPLFKRQIAAGGPVTLTDRRVIRFFMTIQEAVGLVMEAGAMANKGELYVLDMGKPVRILDLAENMITLSGMKPYEDIDIVEIGLRPGEKLYEEMLIQTEKLDHTANCMIFIEKDRAYSREEMEEKLRILREALQVKGGEGHHDAIIEAIRRTVPTYRNPEEVNGKVADLSGLGNLKPPGSRKAPPLGMIGERTPVYRCSS